MIGIASQWVTPTDDVVLIDERDIDRPRNEIRVDLDTLNLLLSLAGFIRVDNLDPTQIRDA